ncbi:MAG TPA: UrcA family protein [Allosphingosinicella sp.]|nr:UrcA family protein [Allosphingosinicella sp.]
MLKILTALGAAALAASALSTPAAASPAEDEARVVVSYAGLDLSSARDSARLDQRLRAAASQICGEAPGLDLSLSSRVNACKADALGRARTDLRVAMRSGAGRTVALRTN